MRPSELQARQATSLEEIGRSGMARRTRGFGSAVILADLIAEAIAIDILRADVLQARHRQPF